MKRKNKYPLIMEWRRNDTFWFYMDWEEPTSYSFKDVILNKEDFREFMLDKTYTYIKKQNKDLYKMVEEYEKTMINSK